MKHGCFSTNLKHLRKKKTWFEQQSKHQEGTFEGMCSSVYMSHFIMNHQTTLFGPKAHLEFSWFQIFSFKLGPSGSEGEYG